MKPFLPYNILLALTIALTGLMVLYNVWIRDGYAATLQYAYPAVEEREESRSHPEPFDPGDQEAEPPESAPAALTGVRFPLDLNAATEEELKFIPQVGDVMAGRIVQFREHIGGYTDLEQLRNIKGVGDKTYQHLYAYLYIEEEDASETVEEPEPDEEDEADGDAEMEMETEEVDAFY